MEVVFFSEMSTWHHIPEDRTLHRLVFKKRELRKIFGPQSGNNKKTLHNEELHNL
jgi:hypothetical protein